MDTKKFIDEYLERFNMSEATKLPEEDIAPMRAYLEKMMDNISIGGMSEMYINVTDEQNTMIEYAKICKFLDGFVEDYARKNNIPKNMLQLEFINYGKTELVYVLTEKHTKKRTTLLVKQPAVPYGKVKEEHDNLIALSKEHDNIIAPTSYYTANGQELYTTPYMHQARCVASYNTWGMYVPEPIYRFENFTEQQEHIVNQCMIAKLLSLYSTKTNEGLGMCKLGGGDFMLPKGWEEKTPTIDDTMKNLYLIAAREKIKCTLQEYQDILLKEFGTVTITKGENVKVNHRGRVAMKREDIIAGINLGLSLLHKKDNPSNE